MASSCVVAATFLSMAVLFADATHFRAGIIQWSPVGERTIQIFHRVSWRRSRDQNSACKPDEGTLLNGQGSLECRSGCLGTVGDMSFHCTDFSILEDWVTGTRAYNYTLPASTSSFEASFVSCCWISTLVIGRDGNWEVRVRGSIARRPDGLINSSPVTSSNPIVRLQHGCNHVIRIPVDDPDQDIIRCRWAVLAKRECGEVCNAFPHATLDQKNCVISYNAIYQVGLYAVTMQIEDFISSTSTEPLSSVPLQFLVFVSSSNQPCSAKPVFVIPTPLDKSCIPVMGTYTASVVAYAEMSSITDIQTVSPQGLHRTGVSQSSFNSSIYFRNITWTPTIEQFGINIFCFTATNAHGVSSDQRCITLLGGVGGPRVLPNSISPTGVFSPTPSTTWTMTFDQPVLRPEDPRFIRLYESGITTHVYSIDVTNSSAVVFPLPDSDGRLVTFVVTYQFEPGKQYYLLMDAGIAVGDKFCNQESYRIANDTFWTITIKTASIELTPRLGNMLGGTGILIERPSFTGKVECSFDGVDGLVKILNSTLAVCVSPLLQKSGSIPFMLTISDENPLKAQFLSISAEQAHAVTFTGDDIDLLITQVKEITFRWSPESLVPTTLVNNVTVDISLQILYYNNVILPQVFQLLQVESLMTKTENDGEQKVAVNFETFSVACPYTVPGISFSICPVLFKISISPSQYLPSDISIWTGIAFVQQNSVNDTKLSKQCGMWKDTTTHISAHLDRLNHCPPNQLVANFDLSYQREDRTSIITSSRVYHTMFMRFFHPGIKQCYRQSVPDSGGSGQQCCYGKDGVLMKSQVGGTADSVSPLSKYYTHVLQDLMPYVLCCKLEILSCDSYVKGRPEGCETDYRLPLPGYTFGDPHMVTLDGQTYTFNGKGEFILIQTVTEIFSLQGRMEQLLDNQGFPAPGTVFTAIVAKQLPTNTSVQFEVDMNDESLLVLVNGEEVIFGDVMVLEFEGMSLLDKGNKTVLALFSSGAFVEITITNGIVGVMLVSLPESMQRTTAGLMGSFNHIKSDDLMPRNGVKALPLDDSVENIHNKFGMTWIIANESESLFTYRSAESWSNFYCPDFLPVFAPTFTNTTLENEAKKICGDNSFCLFDIAATKRVEIGAATMLGMEMRNNIIEMSKPIRCDPPCKNGVCMENNTCRCSAGFRGDRCTESVLEECEVNICQNNATCSKQVLTYTCTCPAEYTGSLCQDKVPAFRIHMLHSSPRVIDGSVFAEFSTSKTATSICTFDKVKQDCSNGIIQYNNITTGRYTLRIVSKTVDRERYVVRRRIFIGVCAVHLINDGVSISENEATVQFVGTPDVTSFRCRLDGSKATISCRSPVKYSNLAPGQHKVVVLPKGCVGDNQGKLSVKIRI